MKPIIQVEGVSKQYRLGARRAAYGTLRDSLTSVARTPLRYLTRREGTPGDNDNTLWALKDVNFEVQPGEVVGIVGRNGAGKSTLLKILSRITDPTTGRVALYGRVGSLLEVGTGFHPELSGRENIYLNGAILGMARTEIERKFDEIVEFAEVEKFVETPVKHYSSGMYLRLAFAVAAHLEPEILVVDEVLAVGDAQFQKKCLGKMSEVARHGRTVLFVSHNMAAVNQLCSHSIMLANGKVAASGNTPDVIAEYLKSGSGGGAEQTWKDDASRAPGNDRIRLHAVRIISNGAVASEVDIDQEVAIEVEFWNFVPDSRNICTSIYLYDATGVVVLSTAATPAANALKEEWFDKPHPVGLFRATCTLPANFLNEGMYYISVYILTLGPIVLEAEAAHVVSFNVFDTGVMRQAGGGSRWDGVIRIKLPWETEFVQPL
jgi:lipopolysaccharide transport system ATP-binding protein